MKTRRWQHLVGIGSGVVLGLGVAAVGAAQPGPGPFASATLRDPAVPPDVRARAAEEPRQAPTRGAALNAQVERKLQAQFAAADVQGRGRLTREQARAAGLGAVVNHFEQIDTQGQGSVSFEDYKRYLKARGAAVR